MNYKEEINVTKEYKQKYLDSITDLIKEKQDKARENRLHNSFDLIKNQEKYREEFKNMLGWPLTEKVTVPKCVKSELLSTENGTEIYRMGFEIFENFIFYGLFFKNSNDKKPFIIAAHGGGGTPEFISGFYGDTANYNDMVDRTLKYNVHCFAPMYLNWFEETYEIDPERKRIDSELKQIGSSITSLEIYCVMCITSYFENEDYINKEKIGMIGLSYGGFNTLFNMAVDKRIKAGLSCSFFSDRSKCAWEDWVWSNSANKFFDSEIALLCYPRKLILAVGERDDLFNIEYAKDEYKILEKEIKEAKINSDWVDFYPFDGTHEFVKTDEKIKDVIEAL